MSSTFYTKLARDNIGKNRQTYIPYILTCTGMVMMYYIMAYLGNDMDVKRIHGSLQEMMVMGKNVIAVFAVVFLFYTNSFLMKRRKKEFGVFNIMGMEKRHILRVLGIETLYVAVISVISGLLLGLLFSKLMYLLIGKMVQFDVSLGFSVSGEAVFAVIVLFAGIFVLTFLNGMRQIHLSNPVELLSGSQVGEKEPKTKWFIALIGVGTIGVGYYLALSAEAPLQALANFLIAVILVMIGTYCLFIAGSIALLKALRKNKAYYYKTRHFTTISGMIYRMKQNAVGLANICILSTAVLVMISTTISLYLGREDIIMTRFPRDISITVREAEGFETAEIRELVDAYLAEKGAAVTDSFGYKYAYAFGELEGSRFGASDNDVYAKGFSILTFLTREGYEQISGRPVTLLDDEVLFYNDSGKYAEGTVSFGSKDFRIQNYTDGQLESVADVREIEMPNIAASSVGNSFLVVVPDEEAISGMLQELQMEEEPIGYYYAFDVDADKDQIVELHNNFDELFMEYELSAYSECGEVERDDFYTSFG